MAGEADGSGREGRHVVDHVGDRRARRRRRSPSSAARSPAPRAAGHEVVLVSSGAIAAGLPALGLHTRPTDIGTLQAVAAVGQPLLMERIGDDPRRPRSRRRPGAAHAPRLRACARSTCTPARPSAASSTSASCPWSTRTTPSPTTRSATATTTGSPRSVSHLVGADVLVLLTDTEGLFTADPAPRRRGVAHRGDRRGRRRARRAVAGGTRAATRGSGGMASKLAAAKIAAWSGVRAVIAAADAPGVLADADRRPRRSAPRPAPRRAAAEPQALDRVRAGRRGPGRRRRRRPPGALRRPPLAARPPGCGPSRARSTPTTRSRSSTARARPSPRASSATRPPPSATSPAAGPPTCPTGSPTRSSTATTSSSCPERAHRGAFVDGGRRATTRPEGPRAGGRRTLGSCPKLRSWLCWCALRGARFRHTTCLTTRRRPAGGESTRGLRRSTRSGR